MSGFTVNYEPRNWAIPFHQSFRRWATLVLHRRAGKSTAVLHQHQRAANDDTWESSRLMHLADEAGITLTNRQVHELMQNRQYGHILPILKQAKLAAWEDLKRIAKPVKGAEPNESETRIYYPNGNWLGLFGADNPDAFRSARFNGVSFDEFSQHPPNIFGESLSKAMADRMAYGVFIGTIKGKNQLYRFYKENKDDPKWFTLWQDVNVSLETESGATILALKAAMVEDQSFIAKGLMSQEEYDQEWFLSTEAAIKGAYYSKQLAAARREGRIRMVPHDPVLRVHDVWDLGKGENMAVGLFQRSPAREMRFIDYLEGHENDGIGALVSKLQQRQQERGYVYGKHFTPHDIRATELGTGKTRYEIAKKLGWEFTIVRDIGVADGITAGRAMFSRLYIDEKNCEVWLNAIGHYRREWFPKLGVFGPDPVHDWSSHPADMFRYTAVAEDEMTNERPKPRQVETPLPQNVNTAGLGWMA